MCYFWIWISQQYNCNAGFFWRTPPPPAISHSLLCLLKSLHHGATRGPCLFVQLTFLPTLLCCCLGNRRPCGPRIEICVSGFRCLHSGTQWDGGCRSKPFLCPSCSWSASNWLPLRNSRTSGLGTLEPCYCWMRGRTSTFSWPTASRSKSSFCPSAGLWGFWLVGSWGVWQRPDSDGRAQNGLEQFGVQHAFVWLSFPKTGHNADAL